MDGGRFAGYLLVILHKAIEVVEQFLQLADHLASGGIGQNVLIFQRISRGGDQRKNRGRILPLDQRTLQFSEPRKCTV